MSWSIFLCYADGVPQEQVSGLSEFEALGRLIAYELQFPRTPPAVFAVDMDDQEKGNFNSDRLIEEYDIQRV